MKLLGWMHRKLSKNGTEQLRNFSRGNSSSCFLAKPSIDEQLHHAEPAYSFVQSMQQDRMEEATEEDSSYELFHGFLAIGTLGSESFNTEPSTPTFPVPFENGTDKEAEVTENELHLINDELEKFLEAEAKEIADESSARSSYSSIITFCNKQPDDADIQDRGFTITCPLQKYLFGSSIEVPETTTAEKKEKASLDEPFRRNDTIHKDSTEKYESMEKQAKHGNTKHFMKKMLKTLCLTAGSSGTASGAKAAASVATKRKLPKVSRIFRRKVHPEGLLVQKQFTVVENDDMKRVLDEHNTQNKEDIGKKRSPKMLNLKKETTPSELFSKRVESNSIEAKGEHWIKTDADYLVLEL